VLLGQLLAVYLFYKRHWYNVSQNSGRFIVTEIVELISNLNENEKTGYHSSKYLNLSYSIIPTATLPIAQLKYPKELEIFKKLLKLELGQESVIITDGNKKIDLYIALGADLLKIKLPYKALLNPTTEIFVWWIIFLTIFLLSISIIFSKNQIKSIIELADAAERYGRGEKPDGYKPSGANEIRQAGLAFLKMKERIERHTAKRTQMLAMISHDLKTPLTRMKLQIELMQDSEEKEELQYDINSMQHMVDSYLDFSRGEGGEDFKTIDINQWMTQYIRTKWPNNNISTDISSGSIFTLIKPHSFERAMANLISNAVKYSTQIKISICSNEQDVIIIIEDNGKGIEKTERTLVFKSFYRADKSRSLDSGPSVGLGLAITQEIIRGHYGTISLGQSKNLKGLKVTIQLPIKKHSKI
jgi:two-component system osmolarity sensor histidine kinase EnvZ